MSGWLENGHGFHLFLDKISISVSTDDINHTVYLMPEHTQKVLEKILSHIFDVLDLPYDPEFVNEGNQWRINMRVPTEREHLLIGNGREILDAIQHYLRVTVHTHLPDDYTHFLIDINNIRSRREHIIESVIPQIAKKEVEIDGHTIIFVGLSGYERRLVHQELADVTSIETTSVGPRFNRKMIIRPTSDTGSTGIDNAKMFEIDALVRQYDAQTV